MTGAAVLQGDAAAHLSFVQPAEQLTLRQHSAFNSSPHSIAPLPMSSAHPSPVSTGAHRPTHQSTSVRSTLYSSAVRRTHGLTPPEGSPMFPLNYSPLPGSGEVAGGNYGGENIAGVPSARGHASGNATFLDSPSRSPIPLPGMLDPHFIGQQPPQRDPVDEAYPSYAPLPPPPPRMALVSQSSASSNAVGTDISPAQLEYFIHKHGVENSRSKIQTFTQV